MFGVRFILKNSFKANGSNFVVSNFVMQIVTGGIENPVKPKEVAVITKVQSAVTKKKKKEKPKEIKVNEQVEQISAW